MTKAALTLGLCWQTALAEPAGQALPDLTDMNLEDLMNVEVTTVSRKSQSLSSAPAAIYVISNDDIRRSGVTNIPDALRLAPGVMVARVDSGIWAVTSRGFNGVYANKLLVMIDGRSVYSPTYSGVYWEDQDTLLSDVERIEVVRGPGATLWGANAVNGVINIITKHAADTEGWYAGALAGNYEKGSAELRYGAPLGERGFARAYAKMFERGDFKTPEDDDTGNAWEMQSGGFRVDANLNNKTSLRLSGDLNHSETDQNLIVPLISAPYYGASQEPVHVNAGNLNALLTHTLSPVSEIALQTYVFDYRRESYVMDDDETTFDASFQHSYTGWQSQDIVWGLGYRHTDKALAESGNSLSGVKTKTTLRSAFVQDQITLREDTLWLTLGAKFEDAESELQPSARLMWSLNERQKLWASVARAARTPSAVERYSRILTSTLPPGSIYNPSDYALLLVAEGTDDFSSEITTAYELGYRLIARDNLTFDLAVYENHNKNLRNYAIQESGFDNGMLVQPIYFVNRGSITTRGFESSVQWRQSQTLDFKLSYSWFEQDDFSGGQQAFTTGPNPKHMLSLRSAWDLSDSLELDLWYRYMDETVTIDPVTSSPAQIDAYASLDARLAWQYNKDLELALVGQNLLEDQHQEYVPEQFSYPAEIPRSFYLSLKAMFP
ncbi:TonB-dependent receptor [Granulosicoccaceae sp. 1_MG-2023]|nr:TonB-dependent receptor [Granulosicoccaceae sp. 1_MG-2023]